MKNIKTYEGFFDGIRKVFDPNPLKRTEEESWSTIEQELYQMLRRIDIDIYNISVNLSGKGNLLMRNHIKERKLFLRDYGKRHYIIKDGNYYKLDIKKFLKNPDPWIFTKEQKKKCLEYFAKDFKKRVERHKETEGHRSTLNGYVYEELPRTPYLVNPLVNMREVMRKINESNINSEDHLVKDFALSLHELHHNIKQLIFLWNDENKFDVNLTDMFILTDKTWRSNNNSYDEIASSLEHWIDDLDTKFHLNLNLPFYNIFGTNKVSDREEYGKIIYLTLKNIEKEAKECTEKFNKITVKLPHRHYPFEVEMSDLHESIKQWVKSIIGPISEIAMRTETDNAFKNINK